MTAPGLRVRKTIVEFLGDSTGPVFTMDEDGQTGEHASPAALVKAVKRRDTAAARRGESTATVLEWRNPPAGFVQPETA